MRDIDINYSNESHTGIDRNYNTTRHNYIDEHSMKMQKLTLQKGDIQNEDIANVLPRVSSSPQKLSQTGASEEPAFTYSRPPKLPFLQEIHQLKHKEMETEHEERNSHDGSGKKQPTINGYLFLQRKQVFIKKILAI